MIKYKNSPFIFIVIPLLQNLRKFPLLLVILASMANIAVALAPPITSRLAVVGTSVEAFTCQIVKCSDSVASDAHAPQTVTVPAGLHQPTPSTRAISAEVNACDGASVVMDGFTRNEVQTVNDNVPMLGDVFALGLLARSEGETRCKRNLLNLVSPCGSLSPQDYRNVNADSLLHNPTILGSSGSLNRSIEAVVKA